MDEQKDNESDIDVKKVSNNKIMNFFFPKQHCPFCKKLIIENPLYKVDENTGEYLKPLVRDKTKTKGWFRTPWYVIVIFILVVSFSYVYMHDMKQVTEINQNPCKFVEKNTQYCLNQKTSKDKPYGNIDIPVGINK